MQSKKITQAMAVKDLQATRHNISLELATAMVRRFRRFKKQIGSLVRRQAPVNLEAPKFPDGLVYNAADFFQLMKSPGCIGIRCYPAIDAQNQFRLVMVGIDENGNNILPVSPETNAMQPPSQSLSGASPILDEGQASPPYPPPANDL